MPKIVFGTEEHWLGTQKLEVVPFDPATQLVVREAPVEMTNINGGKYLSNPGHIFLIDKDEVMEGKG